jgi:hypothetical protein
MKKVTFELVGPHEGKDLIVNGHQFVGGELEFNGTDRQIETLTRVFSFYGALPSDQVDAYYSGNAHVETDELLAGDEAKTRENLDKALAALPGEYTDPEFVVSGMREFFGDLFTDADEARVRELVVAKADDTQEKPPVVGSADAGDTSNGNVGKPSLAEALAALDPENDAHWTSNNLPALDVLDEMTGLKNARSDVAAIADGYTRAKARAART